MPSSVCIITARGGSKRIPRKNVREFCGKPMLAYSVETAVASGIFDVVMVSTDDDEIADVARKYGAEVPFMRSEATSNDYATTSDVLREVLSDYGKCGAEFDTMCCLYPTAPFVQVSELKEASAMIEAGASSRNPLLPRSISRLCAASGWVRTAHSSMPSPSSPRPAVRTSLRWFTTAGGFTSRRVASFHETGSFITNNTRFLRIPSRLVQDIDTPEDWELAEQKYRAMTQED